MGQGDGTKGEGMTEWSVMGETKAPDGVSVNEDDLMQRIGDLAESLADRGAVGGGDRRGWDIRLMVEAEEVGDACVEAQAIVTVGATLLGIPTWPVDRIEAVSSATRADELRFLQP